MTWRTWSLAVLLGLSAGCAPLQLASYATSPDYPRFEPNQSIRLTGLRKPVSVVRREDGLWKVTAADERDAMRAQGFLVASDRMFQLDLFRHMARGELAALLGDRPFAAKTTLEADVYNRFLGFHRDALTLLSRTSADERELIQAYADGINAWIAIDRLSLEHRLLGADRIREWEPADSIAIYLMLMHSLSGNADREIRRLLIACEAGIDAVQQVFPTDIEFGSYALPQEGWRLKTYQVAPAIVAEMRKALPGLCPAGAEPARSQRSDGSDLGSLALFSGQLSSLSASNNWVITGPLSQSGFPLLSNDPHLPHMNPPIVWGVELETPGHHVAGFTIPGLHRIVFGHNFHVAWGATTNHVDRQDLVIHRLRSETRAGRTLSGYEVDGKIVPFEYRREHFEVRGGSPREVTARFTSDGPLLNDLEPQLAGKIPLTAIRLASLGAGSDLDGAREINRARNMQDFIRGIDRFDQGCSNWVFGDERGGLGYRSPCRLPVRRGWQGTFPIPGWLSRYRWPGYVRKADLPTSINPDRGWLVTANSQIIPSRRFFTAYNNDAQAPWRMLRIADRIAADVDYGITAESSAAIQMDVVYQPWPRLRASLGRFCQATAPGLRQEDAALLRQLCAWDGSFAPSSTMATLFALWSTAVLEHTLTDALPDGAEGETWRYIASLPQFEAVAQWIWTRPEGDSIWDDVTTTAQEQRYDILVEAFRSAADEGRRR
ncbi:MAG TPA: penicillin acylase family protein, partial [Terriglobales bacterium]|nr:penicillin acylase family protein [Terriglobales bacterium]